MEVIVSINSYKLKIREKIILLICAVSTTIIIYILGYIFNKTK